MRLELTGKGLDITPGLRQLVNKRLQRVARLLGNSLVSVQCVLSKQKYVHRVDLTVHAAGDHVMAGVGEARSFSPAITAAVEKIMQQSYTLKDKWKDRRKADARRAATRKRGPAPAAQPAEAETPATRIRRLRYPIKPMTIDEAAGLLQENGDQFLVFRNARTEAVAIMVRRPNGNLGLIET